MRQYYSIFDLENSRVGLAGSSYQEPFQLTFVMIAAVIGIVIMASVMLRVTFLMCKKNVRNGPINVAPAGAQDNANDF